MSVIMNCKTCGRVVFPTQKICECGEKLNGNMERIKDEKYRVQSLCRYEGCGKPWVVDHYCREHYQQVEKERDRAQKAKEIDKCEAQK